MSKEETVEYNISVCDHATEILKQLTSLGAFEKSWAEHVHTHYYKNHVKT